MCERDRESRKQTEMATYIAALRNLQFAELTESFASIHNIRMITYMQFWNWIPAKNQSWVLRVVFVCSIDKKGIKYLVCVRL